MGSIFWLGLCLINLACAVVPPYNELNLLNGVFVVICGILFLKERRQEQSDD